MTWRGTGPTGITGLKMVVVDTKDTVLAVAAIALLLFGGCMVGPDPFDEATLEELREE